MTLFLICPKLLREVFLDQVEPINTFDHKYTDDHWQCSDRLLEVLEYHNSSFLVLQMMLSPLGFNKPVVLWSNLRVLTLAPDDSEGMSWLRHILDAACNTLEELCLTGLVGKMWSESRCGSF
jgi:hypothetical protein